MRLLYSTIKKSKIMESTYEELTNAMAKKYVFW